MKRNWAATPGALTRLVEWLDAGADSGGESYVTMHRRLASYFARKSCRAADDLADETLTRVARRLEEQGRIDGVPAKYCYIVARFVFLESLRNPEARNLPVPPEVPDVPGDDDAGREQTLDRLDECLDQLDPEDRQLILDYYSGARDDRITNRRTLALKLGLSLNALTIRASRLRDRLRACVARSAGR